ncbi:unnamed protein product [Calypogeia fissa]
MAGLEGAHADEGYANTGGPKDGPVLTMMSKRLRALRKKFNRILQIEENKAQGKTVNKEQEEVLKTKIAIAALIDEYEKLRQPLLVAVKGEVAEREKELLAASLERQDEETSVADEKEGKEGAAVLTEAEAEKQEGTANAEESPQDAAETANGFANGAAELQDGEVVDEEAQAPVSEQEDGSVPSRGMTDAQIADLLTLLYFSQLFDVRSPGETPSSFVWTKVHERSSCLSYDFVRDDATTPLIEGDLDALSIFGSMLTTRPPNVTLSHKDALEKCVDHAKAWLAASENHIGESHAELPISYSGLRERLNRILASEYFTMTPEITTVSQQTAAAAATAAGQYVTKVFVPEAPLMTTISNEVVIDDAVYRQDGAAPSQYYQAREYIPAVSLVVANGIPVPSPLIAVANTPPFVPETLGQAVDVPQFGSHDDSNQETPDTDAVPEQEHENTQSVPTQQTQPQNQGYYGGGPRGGGYQNPRGRMGYQGGRGRGGFPNGRGGRGGRGGYPNSGRGDRQFYDQGGQGGQGREFYPRNQNYYGGGGRGGRGPRGYQGGYNGHPNGPAQSAPAPPPAAVATGSA